MPARPEITFSGIFSAAMIPDNATTLPIFNTDEFSAEVERATTPKSKHKVTKLTKRLESQWRRNISRTFSKLGKLFGPNEIDEIDAQPIGARDGFFVRRGRPISTGSIMPSERAENVRKLVRAPSQMSHYSTGTLSQRRVGIHGPNGMEIVRTSPSGRRLTIHSYKGPQSRPETPKRRSVLVAHPAVTGVIRPSSRALSEMASIASQERPSTTASDHSTLDFPSQVNPKQMWRESLNGARSTTGADNGFTAFCDNLDGIKQRPLSGTALQEHAQPISEEPRSSSVILPYIPKVAALSLHGFDSGHGGEREQQRHRQEALDALEGTIAAPEPSITGVSMGKEKIQHPESITPGFSPAILRVKPLERLVRTGELYVAMPGDRFTLSSMSVIDPFTPSGDDITSTAQTSRRWTYDCPADFDPHRSLYNRVESGHFDAQEWGRPATPLTLADGKVHRSHYNWIESGICEPVPVAAIERSRNSTTISAAGKRDTYFGTDCPVEEEAIAMIAPKSAPSPRPTSQCPRTAPLPIKRKPVPVVAKNANTMPNFSRPRPLPIDKPLPAIPSPTNPRRFTNGIVPDPLRPPPFPAKPLGEIKVPECSNKSMLAGATPALPKQSKKDSPMKKEKMKVRQMAEACGKMIVCGRE